MKNTTFRLLFPVLSLLVVGSVLGREVVSFNKAWFFKNQEDIKTNVTSSRDSGYAPLFRGWPVVTLPHTAKVEPLVVSDAWGGISWYSKPFPADPSWKGKTVNLTFEGVMQEATVWLNHVRMVTHQGGYLPFTIDITPYLDFNNTNWLIVRTDNRDNPQIPPGKPVKNLDFCYYSGIYRNVSLTVTDPLHITDAVQENLPASGGIRVWYPEVTAAQATVSTAVHVRNSDVNARQFRISCRLLDAKGRNVAASVSENQELKGSETNLYTQQMQVLRPALWHPDHPNLYTLQVRLLDGKQVVDSKELKIGIRSLALKNDRLQINGQPFLMRGTNRHQEYPYIGNALSDNAQYRDALLIKKAGFNVVRLSHYPQAEAFMDACDELGILTIAAIPGWQFFGDSIFVLNAYQNARELIRRDRNHPCVALWELSLNESGMPGYFMEKMHAIAQEESPDSKLLTCGWTNKFYDVWIPARQHGKAPNYWKNYQGRAPLFTGEYGDWEYFAQDAGLNQAGYANLKSDERTSRQLRGDGEKRMLQQAMNFQEAHNDNLRNPHLGDANWLMFDYNRGYSPIIESSGVADLFRLPKFAYYFYQSQQSPNAYVKPMVKVASYWNGKSDAHVLKVFSNCDEVALFRNNTLVERKRPSTDVSSDQLKHPPFIFDLNTFEPGTLKAVGFLHGKAVATDQVTTASTPYQLRMEADLNGKALKADGSDVIVLHATVCDQSGNPVCDAQAEVRFELVGEGQLIGGNPIQAEAGIASILLKAGETPGKLLVRATSGSLKTGLLTVKAVR